MKVSVDYSYDIKEYGRTILEVKDLEDDTLQDEVEKYVESIMEDGAVVTDIVVESYQEIK
jgi:hypothetical protein